MQTKTGTFESILKAALLSAAAFLFSACGDDPSFLEEKVTRANSADAVSGDTDDQGMQIEPNSSGDPDSETGDDYADVLNDRDEEVLLPGGGAGDWMPDWVDADGDGADESGDDDDDSVSNHPSDGPVYNIPGASDSDQDALHKCMEKWGDLPFGQTITNFRKIYASVTVGGYGNAINDNRSTANPELVLIYAGVNVGGAPNWNLMNKNGYYCAVANVNVNTQFTINLHCNARLADSKVNVNVGSTQTDTTADVGVHVGSTVTVNTVSPEGDQCIR